jgi:hypothetical protein
MRVEMLPGVTNVVRFPVERLARPTVVLLREIAPDVRDVLALAEHYGIEPPDPHLRAQSNLATAEWILNQVPPTWPEHSAMLAQCLDVALRAAIAACHEAQETDLQLRDAQQALTRAEIPGGYWMAPLREQVEALAERVAVSLITAHARAEEAEGVARAVGLAQRRVAWTPRNVAAEMEEPPPDIGFSSVAGVTVG